MSLITKLTGILILTLSLLACDADDASRQLAEASGLSHVIVHYYQKEWACEQGDIYMTPISGVDVKGNLVKAVVCCARFKACTLQYLSNASPSH